MFLTHFYKVRAVVIWHISPYSPIIVLCLLLSISTLKSPCIYAHNTRSYPLSSKIIVISLSLSRITFNPFFMFSWMLKRLQLLLFFLSWLYYKIVHSLLISPSFPFLSPRKAISMLYVVSSSKTSVSFFRIPCTLQHTKFM